MKRGVGIVFGMTLALVINAQELLFDNGPMVTHVGVGFGGADVSMASKKLNTAGSNTKFLGPTPGYYSTADNFSVSEDSTLTSIVLHAYQTNFNNPTWDDVSVNLWSGKPGAGGTVIATATEVRLAPTNVYRLFNEADFLNEQRLVNAVTAKFANISLTQGTQYWVSFQVIGGTTGWANYVMLVNPSDPNDPITKAGDALQFRDQPPASLTNFGWWPCNVGTPSVNVEFPFEVYGVGKKQVIAPDSENIVLGTTNSGGSLASWAADDNNGRKICRFSNPNSLVMTQTRLTYTTIKFAPTAVSFNVKISGHTPGVQQVTLRVENKITNLFVDTNVVLQNIVDGTTYNGVPPGTLANYVGGGGGMRGEIEIKQVGITALAFPCTTFEFAQMAVTG